MKVWQKQKKKDLGKALFSWRYRATRRFFTKIFTWLLGGFVSGIITSIIFLIIGLPAYSATSARVVFFAVFLSGMVGAFIRNICNGLEYVISEKALVHFNPAIDIKAPKTALAHIVANRRTEYVLWDNVKEIADQDGSLLLTLKEHEEPIAIGVAPVASYSPASAEEIAGFPGLFKRNEKLDKEILKKVVQKAREAKKALQQ